MLTEADFREVYRTVFTARAKWFPLGLELGLRHDILTSLSVQDPPQNLETVLRAWLNDPYLKPCWENLVTALREMTVHEGVLANEIIKKYLGMLYEIFNLICSNS